MNVAASGIAKIVFISSPDNFLTFKIIKSLCVQCGYVAIQEKGTEYFHEGFGIQHNFWRAPNDNDYGSQMPKRLQIWKQSSKNFNVVDASLAMDGKDAVLKVSYLLAAGNLYIATYRIHPSGVVKANYTFTSTEMEAAKTEAS